MNNGRPQKGDFEHRRYYAKLARQRKKRMNRYLMLAAALAVLVAAVVGTVKIYDYVTGKGSPTAQDSDSSKYKRSEPETVTDAEKDAAAVAALGKVTAPDYIDVDYIGVGKARTGQKLTGIHNIVVHYTGNPGTTAKQNHSYFSQSDTEVCSHFVVGIDGEIIQCVPLDEQSAASNWRNVDTISVEVCHADKTGKFSEKAYQSTVKLVAWLCEITGLDAENVIRHHDVTGKDCPLYYVKHPDEWEIFQSDVAAALSGKVTAGKKVEK